MEAYLDNSATTKCYDEVAQIVSKVMTEDYGNPSSMHHKGVVAENYIREAKKIIADTLRANPAEILFTSGGTESDNLALIGTARAYGRNGKHMITTSIEHPAILETMKYLEKEGFEITYLPVDERGIIRLSDLEAALRPDTILVSIMAVNNEIGSVQPLAQAGALIKSKNPGTIFHVDAVQGYGKLQLNPKKMNIDLMSVSGHKIHGPKGIGFLYVKSGVRLVPINYGGGQQKGMRSGTENVPGIAGLATAAKEIYRDFDGKTAEMRRLKRLFEQLVSDGLEDVQFNGPAEELGITDGGNTEAGAGNSATAADANWPISAPHIISASIRGVRAEVLLHALEDKEVYVSAGSACATNHPHISDTLQAIHLDKDLLDSTLRFSLSDLTTEEEIRQAADAVISVVPMLRRYSRQ